MNRFYGRCVVDIMVGASLFDAWLNLTFSDKGIDSTKEVLLVIGFSQIAMKLLFLEVYKGELILLMNNIRMFWKPNFFKFKPEEENEKILSFVKFSLRSYISLLLTICLLYFIRPLFLSESELPRGSCCSKFFNYNVCYTLAVIQAPVLVLTVSGFDALYVLFITYIICEFKLVESRFPNLNIDSTVRGTDKEAMQEVIQLIDHHNLILDCIKIMKHMYSKPMLGFFLLNMFGMCFAVMIMTSSTSAKSTKILFGMVTVFYLIQLFFYCISGSMLADESVKISAQVYKSNWWIKTQPELRKALIMVIRRSNKPEILTAGGLLQVNLQTFTMILRSTVSFFTFMQVIYGNS